MGRRGGGYQREQGRKSRTRRVYGTFLHFIAQQEDLVPSLDAAAVPVDPADPQLGRVRGPWWRPQTVVSERPESGQSASAELAGSAHVTCDARKKRKCSVVTALGLGCMKELPLSQLEKHKLDCSRGTSLLHLRTSATVAPPPQPPQPPQPSFLKTSRSNSLLS